MSRIDVDATVNCRTGDAGRGLACAGADKPHTVYGALTWLALGRPLPFAVLQAPTRLVDRDLWL
jgi:hypothetical protein